MKIADRCADIQTFFLAGISAQEFVKSLSPGAVFWHPASISQVYVRTACVDRANEPIAMNCSNGLLYMLSTFSTGGNPFVELKNATLVKGI